MPVKEASLLHDPGPQAAGSSVPQALAEASVTRLSSGDAEAQANANTASGGCQRTAHAQAGTAPSKAQLPESHVGLHTLQQSLLPPNLHSALSSSRSMQQPWQYPTKKLTLRERVKLMKGSG